MRSKRDFDAVLALARFGNFTRAAESLGMTQSALTRQLQKIEELLGVELFDRTSRGVELTVFGKIVLERSEAILNGFGDINREIELARNQGTGELRIVATMFPAEISVSRAIAGLSLKYPNIHVHLTIEDQPDAVQKVLKREADIGVVWRPQDAEEGLTCKPMPRRNHVFYCRDGHPLAQFPRADIRQIAAYPMVGFLMGHQMTPIEPEFGQAAGSFNPETGEFTPKILVNSFAAACQIVRSSNAISWAPMRLLRDKIRDGSIVTFDFSSIWFLCGYEVIWVAERSRSPAAVVFCDILNEIEATDQ